MRLAACLRIYHVYQNQTPRPPIVRTIANPIHNFTNMAFCSSERKSRGPQNMVAVAVAAVDVVLIVVQN